MNPDVSMGIDGFQALGHGIGLGTTVLSFQRMQLAVGVGHADIVHVDQRQGADAAAGQGLGGPGTDTAESDDGYVGIPECFQGTATVEPLDSPKTKSEVVRGHSASINSRPVPARIKGANCNPGTGERRKKVQKGHA